MSQENATYLLNELNPDLKNGTVLTGDESNISKIQINGTTVLSTTGAVRALNDLNESGLISKVNLPNGTTEFKSVAFKSSDGSISITNVDGINGNPTLDVVQNKTLSKIDTSVVNNGNEINMPARSKINFINQDGITISTAKTFGETDEVDVGISSVDIPKNIVSSLTAPTVPTFEFTTAVEEDNLNIVFGNAFPTQPTEAGILTYLDGVVQGVVPEAYVKSLEVKIDSSAADVFTMSVSPMSLDEPSPPQADISINLDFNTISANEGESIGWNTGTNKAFWQALGVDSISPVGFTVDPSFSSIISSPDPNVLETTGSFTFNYNTEGVFNYNIYTPRWNTANLRYEWSTFIESFSMTVNASMSNILLSSPTPITYTGSIPITLVPPPSPNRTIIFDGTNYIWGTIEIGSMTSIGINGDNRIAQTNTSPITTGDANFRIGIDTSGALANQTLVAATTDLDWGNALDYVSQQPYVIAQGLAEIAAYISGSGATTQNGTVIIRVTIPGGTSSDYRVMAWSATQSADTPPSISPQQAFVLDALDAFGRLQIRVLNRAGSGTASLGTWVQYIVLKVS